MGISSFSENVPTGALYTAFTSKASSPFCRIPPHHAGESGLPESAGRACRVRVIVRTLETITPPPHTERRPVRHVLALHRRPVRPCAPHLFDMGGELVQPRICRRFLGVHHLAAVFLVSRAVSSRQVCTVVSFARFVYQPKKQSLERFAHIPKSSESDSRLLFFVY